MTGEPGGKAESTRLRTPRPAGQHLCSLYARCDEALEDPVCPRDGDGWPFPAISLLCDLSFHTLFSVKLQCRFPQKLQMFLNRMPLFLRQRPHTRQRRETGTLSKDTSSF